MNTRVKVAEKLPVTLEYPFLCYMAWGKNIEQQCRCTVQHNGGAQHELISVLGIYVSLTFKGKEESFQVVCHLNKSSLQHSSYF